MVFDPRIPAREECVLGYQLERWAHENPDGVAIVFHDGGHWTWAEALDQTRRAARAFQALGVAKGDHVLSWLPNGPDAVVTWFGLNYLGAVYVPLNTAYKGGVLEHLVGLSDAELIVCHADLAPRLGDIDTAGLTDIVVTGGEATVEGLTTHPSTVLRPDDGLDGMPHEVEPWDTQYIIFTSGTTGPSKAVLSSYLQGYSMGPDAHTALDGDDRILINLPLFHVGGTLFVIVTLATGGSCYIDTHFKTDQFWSTVVDHEITATCLLAAMIPFLLKLPPFEGERDHPLRKAMVVPWNEDAMAVVERYDLGAWTTFNMTEVSSPLISGPSPTSPGTCGTPRPGVEARVVDENDCEVGPGVTGELIVRTDRPWAMNHGYYKNPEATAEAWRNGWFHTGDGFRYDEDGNFYFVDRIKDAIRRRGENISSFEVENEVTAHPDVAEAAAIGVPSELGEDEVMIVVAPVEGADIDPEELLGFLQPRMAHFMLPRYIRTVDELPKTPTQKVQKHLLKGHGLGADTWDREAAGIEIKRERIGSANTVDSEPRNAASDLIRENWPNTTLESFTSGDLLDGFDDDFVREDRRKVVAAPTANAEEYLAGMVEYFSVDDERAPVFFVDRIVAVRGRRLALAQLRIQFASEWSSEVLVVVQQNESIDRFQKAIRFDVDDVDAAIAELDRLAAELGDDA